MALAGSLTWGQATATVAVGQTVTVPITSDIALTNRPDFSPEAEIVSSTTAEVVLRGLAAGTKTIAANTSWSESSGGSTWDMVTTNAFALTVTTPVEDESYLNKRGLTHFWENIDDLKLDTTGTAYRTAAIPYGEVDSTSTATAFTATVPGIAELRDGVCVLLKNGVVTSTTGFTININGLGAKQSYNNMASATADTTIFNINYTMLFVYDSTRVAGGGWICYRGYNSDTNTIGYQLRTNSTQLTTTDRTRYYRLLFTSADNTQWVPANTQYDNSATSVKTVNQRKINPFGRIVYMSGTTNVAAGGNISATAVWDQYALTLGYSFNNTGAALALTTKTPVYVKCAPQSDGSAIIDSTTPFVQTLPSTEDGKIYIFLGIAYSATQIELVQEKPVYHYKDGCIRLWTNQTTGVTSFNGNTGAVTYTAPVTSVNGSTGAITGLQTTGNLVTSVSGSSTDSQYPSAKLFYDTIGNVETILNTLNNGGGAQ